MKNIGFAIAGFLGGLWTIGHALAADPSPAVPAKDETAALAPFQDELARTDFPSHVAGLAVVEAKVTAVKETSYCPMRTALCGRNPTCDHPKRIMRTCQLTVIRPLANPAGIDIPTGFENVSASPAAGETLQPGQIVHASFFAYRNGVPPQVSRLVTLPPPPPAP